MTTTDTMDYGPVPANVKHAVDRLVQAHGFAEPVAIMGAVVAWNSGWCSLNTTKLAAEAGRYLLLAASLLKRVEESQGSAL